MSGGAPRLLVSVRNEVEARAAMTGGADVIDVKEPSRGPMGRADDEVTTSIVAAVGDVLPVSAAWGELADLGESDETEESPGGNPGGDPGGNPGGTWVLKCPSRLAHVKVGLAGMGAEWCDRLTPWLSRWPAPVVVAYADFQAANAPSIWNIPEAAAKMNVWGVMLDTWSKDGRPLTDHIPLRELAWWIDLAHSLGLNVGLAGSLSGRAFDVAARLRPNLVGVRSAACYDNKRHAAIDEDRVARLRRMISLQHLSESTDAG